MRIAVPVLAAALLAVVFSAPAARLPRRDVVEVSYSMLLASGHTDRAIHLLRACVRDTHDPSLRCAYALQLAQVLVNFGKLADAHAALASLTTDRTSALADYQRLLADRLRLRGITPTPDTK